MLVVKAAFATNSLIIFSAIKLCPTTSKLAKQKFGKMTFLLACPFMSFGQDGEQSSALVHFTKRTQVVSAACSIYHLQTPYFGIISRLDKGAKV